MMDLLFWGSMVQNLTGLETFNAPDKEEDADKPTGSREEFKVMDRSLFTPRLGKRQDDPIHRHR